MKWYQLTTQTQKALTSLIIWNLKFSKTQCKLLNLIISRVLHHMQMECNVHKIFLKCIVYNFFLNIKIINIFWYDFKFWSNFKIKCKISSNLHTFRIPDLSQNNFLFGQLQVFLIISGCKYVQRSQWEYFIKKFWIIFSLFHFLISIFFEWNLCKLLLKLYIVLPISHMSIVLIIVK